jgi:tRNA (guanine37-N1)-methyltransferase
MVEPSGRLIALTPSGQTLTQEWVRTLAREPRLVLLCGRYEGFDERIFEVLEPELLSIGDYVLSGGEVAAMVVIDAVMRLIPGVLGDAESAEDESFGIEGGLEYPHYTRPREYRGRGVPEILLGGDHAAIDRWRRAQARARTIDRRGDLIAKPSETHAKSPSHTTIEHNEIHEPPGEPGEPDRAERMG